MLPGSPISAMLSPISAMPSPLYEFCGFPLPPTLFYSTPTLFIWLFGNQKFRNMTSCKMVFWKFLKNEQSYSKSTGNKLPLLFEDLILFSCTFLSITNIFARIWKKFVQKFKLCAQHQKVPLTGPCTPNHVYNWRTW